MLDHRDVRDAMEVAAAEPGGLDRMMAGDTFEAASIAGHLAGCPDCTDEFGRLRRASAILRDVISTEPGPELRERTLAFVAAVGRPRPASAVTADARLAGGSGRVVPGTSERVARGLTRPMLAWAAATAAAVIVSVAVTAALLGGAGAGTAGGLSPEAGVLGRITATSLRIETQTDARSVVLTAAAGGPAVGRVEYSGSSGELVVVASGIARPPAGQEYRCWVVIEGQRTRLGEMYFSGDVAYWIGRIDLLAQVQPGARFGVSLVDASGTPIGPDPVMGGTL